MQGRKIHIMLTMHTQQGLHDSTTFLWYSATCHLQLSSLLIPCVF